jgi:hypothetical protein
VPWHYFAPSPKAVGSALSGHTDQRVCKVVKAYAERTGPKATEFGVHSLRGGFPTSAVRRGAFKIQNVSWQDVATPSTAFEMAAGSRR